jgi:mRNA interferase MazF
MGTFAAGQTVIVHFPFSDLTASKLRPAIVLAEAGRDDWILCQVTSQPYGDAGAIRLDTGDFLRGSLRLTSYARPGKLFTAHASLVAGQVAELHPVKFKSVRDAVIHLIQTGKA